MMKTRSAIALGILLASCLTDRTFAAASNRFTGHLLNSCGNASSRVAQNLSISPWSGNGHAGCFRVVNGHVEIKARSAGAKSDPRESAQITVTPDPGWRLEDMQLSWRIRSASGGASGHGSPQADVWAYAGTNRHAAAAFGAFTVPSNGFAFINWTPKVPAGPEKSVTLLFHAWSAGQANDSMVMILDDVRLSGRMVAVSPSSTERLSSAVLVLCDFTSSISNALASLQHSSATESLMALAHQLRVQQENIRTCLLGAGLITVSALLSFLLTGWLLIRAQAWHFTSMGRLDKIIAARNAAGVASPLSSPSFRGDSSDALQQSTARHLNTLERLIKRVRRLEEVTPGSNGVAGACKAGATTEAAMPLAPIERKSATGDSRPSEPPTKTNASLEFDALLGKGQTLLNLNQHAQAQQCFAEASRLRPNDKDALIQNGLALERLQRFADAVICYERVLALDPSFSMAWLHLGRIYNRLERHPEAFACYERAARKERRALNALNPQVREVEQNRHAEV